MQLQVGFVLSTVLDYILNHIHYWVKKEVGLNKKRKEKNHGLETTAVSN